MSGSEDGSDEHGSGDEHHKRGPELAASCATRPLTVVEKKRYKEFLAAWFNQLGDLVVGADDKRLRWRCGLCQDLIVMDGSPAGISEHLSKLHPDVDPSAVDSQPSSSSSAQSRTPKPRPPRELVVDEKGMTKEAFRNLPDALLKARDGDTVLVKSGKYPLQKPLFISKRITVKGVGPQRSKIQIYLASGTQGSSLIGPPEAVLVLSGGTGGIITNLMVKGTARGGGILVRQGPWVISNCEVQGDTGKTLACVQLGEASPSGGDGCAAKVTGCELHGGTWGVYMAPGAGRQVEKCEIHDCTDGGIAYRSAALNCFIDSNVVHDIQGPAILVDDDASGEVEGNMFWSCDGVAVSSRCKASFVNNKKYKQEPPGGAAALLPTEVGAVPRRKVPVEIEEPEPEKFEKGGCGSFYSFIKIICQAGRGVDDH
eukprot:tig00020800_g13739.t1